MFNPKVKKPYKQEDAVQKKVIVLKKTKKVIGDTTVIVLVKGSVQRDRAAMECAPPRVERATVLVVGNAYAEIPAHMRRACGGKRHHAGAYA